jgi:hypothetical protein
MESGDRRGPNVTTDIELAAKFVLEHGRLLDRRRFERLFGDGDPVASTALVMRALLAYQNPDGGFGHAIESDIRASASQTVGAEVALRTMAELGTIDTTAVRLLCDWCSANALDGGALPFALPAVTAGPRAPWWQPTDAPSLNPTAAIVGLAMRLGVEHEWVGRATQWCWAELDSNASSIDHHTSLCAIEFLEAASLDPRAARIDGLVRARVLDDLVELNPAADGYVFPPLQFARHPDAIGRRWFDDSTIETHLDALQAGQAADGGWTIPWEPPSTTALSEWRAIVTIDALRTLRAYNRL